MKRTCDGCGHEAVEGEMFITEINPNSEWWLCLFDGPFYCQKCADKRRKEAQQ
jgi:hypothetical protein